MDRRTVEITLSSEDVHMILASTTMAIEAINERMKPECTDSEMVILAREKMRFEKLSDKFERASLLI